MCHSSVRWHSLCPPIRIRIGIRFKVVILRARIVVFSRIGAKSTFNVRVGFNLKVWAVRFLARVGEVVGEVTRRCHREHKGAHDPEWAVQIGGG